MIYLLSEYLSFWVFYHICIDCQVYVVH